MLKTTSLDCETDKRICLASVLDDYNELVKRGMLTWEAYKEYHHTIENSLQIIRDSIRKYKERRLQMGLFYLVQYRNGHGLPGIQPHTHLYHMPLREALRKWRQEIKKRKQLLDASNNSGKLNMRDTIVLSSSLKRLVVYTLSSIILGCVIIFL
ncbi:unnamed protein product [Triticum aestivum]|uniref:Uncharacterized protein n=1 Tax=Triticum aestivum TaxID=4565 RepID=A0A7H4LQK6_WHEAT|nr:unnamed protein product [Triticum aestivum]